MNYLRKQILKIITRKKQSNWGQGLVEYALILVIIAAGGALALAAVGTDVKAVFNQIVQSIGVGAEAANEEIPPGTLEVSVYDNEGHGVADTYVYAYDDNRDWAGLSMQTNSAGMALFEDMEDGAYQFLAYESPYYYWSQTITFPKQSQATIKMNVQQFTVSVVDGDGKGIKHVYVYAYTADEKYWLGVYGRTHNNGKATLDLPDGDYKFRAYYDGYWYWSPQFNSPDQNETTVEIREYDITVTVVDDNGDGVKQSQLDVYGYTEDGTYTGVNGRTNGNGRAKLTVPAGSYKFRVYFRTSDYWSDLVRIPGTDEIVIQTEERPFTVKVMDNEGEPVKNVSVYAFTGNLDYFDMHSKTNNHGEVVFDLPQGNYKFRADYKGDSYWSTLVSTTGSDNTTITVNKEKHDHD